MNVNQEVRANNANFVTPVATNQPESGKVYGKVVTFSAVAHTSALNAESSCTQAKRRKTESSSCGAYCQNVTSVPNTDDDQSAHQSWSYWSKFEHGINSVNNKFAQLEKFDRAARQSGNSWSKFENGISSVNNRFAQLEKLDRAARQSGSSSFNHNHEVSFFCKVLDQWGRLG